MCKSAFKIQLGNISHPSYHLGEKQFNRNCKPGSISKHIIVLFVCGEVQVRNAEPNGFSISSLTGMSVFSYRERDKVNSYRSFPTNDKGEKQIDVTAGAKHSRRSLTVLGWQRPKDNTEQQQQQHARTHARTHARIHKHTNTT